MCLAEKGLEYKSHLLQLQKFEQHDPEYLKLNPKGVVPTLVHDGRPVTESSIIIEYIDDAFPEPPLRPADPMARAAMRHWLKWSDDTAYGAVYIPTWDKLSRPAVEKLSDAELDAMLARIPTVERRERWRTVARGGFDEAEFADAYGKMESTFRRMEDVLGGGDWLAGNEFSLADIAIIPFIDRMLDLRSDLAGAERYPAVHGWLARIKARPSFEAAFFFGGMDASTGAVQHALQAQGT